MSQEEKFLECLAKATKGVGGKIKCNHRKIK